MAEPIEPPPTSNDIAPERLAASPEAFREPGNHRFRKRYRQLSPWEESVADAIKDKAGELADLYDILGKHHSGIGGVAREIAIAHTHLEDSVYRAIKGLTA
jgi:hypothetical protein